MFSVPREGSVLGWHYSRNFPQLAGHMQIDNQHYFLIPLCSDEYLFRQNET